MNNKYVLIGIMAAMLYMMLAQVAADVGGADSIGRYISTGANLNGSAAGSTYAAAGNVTELEINATLVSQFWQGFYGNISGKITLDNGNNESMYNWNLRGVLQGEIYASRASDVDFSLVDCLNASAISDEELAIGQNTSTSKGDNISETFLFSNSHPAFNVGDVTIAADDCAAMNTYVSGASQTLSFFNLLLVSDSTTIYTTLINDSAVGFDGQSHDFQLMVGENGNLNDAGGTTYTTYFFYAELADS